MDKEIREIIEKNLPNHVGSVLREKLAKAENDEQEVDRLKIRVSVLEKDVRDKDGIIKEYAKFDVRNQELNDREKAIKEMEISARVRELSYELEAEKDKTKFAKDVALGLVRNSEYRKSIMDSVNEPYIDNNGCHQYVNKSQNSTETKTVE